MKQFTDNLTSPVIRGPLTFLTVLPGASVTVTISGTTTLATIYSDDGVTVKANPIITDGLGYYAFYAADGEYKLTYAGNFTTFSREIDLIDFTDLAASGGAARVGRAGGGTVQDEINSLHNGVAVVRVASLEIDPTGGFFNRSALITTLRDVVNPAGIVPSLSQVVVGNGDNTTFRGVSGGYIKAKDRAGITASQRGVLYGLQLSVEPIHDRNNFPFDDAVGVVVSNEGTGRGTEGIYFGRNTGITNDWGACIGLDANAYAGAYMAGSYQYGIDCCLTGGVTGQFAQAWARVPNNVVAITGRNAAGSADIPLLKLNASNNVELGGKEVIPRTTYSAVLSADSGVFTSASVIESRYSKMNGIVSFSALIQVVTKGTALGGLRITLPATPTKSAVVSGVNASDGHAMIASIGNGNTYVRMTKYDGSDPLADGKFYTISGHYEVA